MINTAELCLGFATIFCAADMIPSLQYYDAIFMDVMMPRMNGYEATAAIRKLPRGDAAAIRIIAMTANAFVEDVQAALDAGMNAHVSKPVDMDRLAYLLNKL